MAEYFETVGFNGDGFRRWGVETLVRHHEDKIGLYCLDDCLKVLHAARDLFQHKSVFYGKTVNEYVAYGKRLQHPVLGRIVFEYFRVADIILVAVFPFAFDDNTEHIFDCFF